MKYFYVYKTSDGVRHEAAMDAPSREFVFESLREQGIRAIKVIAADGSRANGEIRGVRKRVVTLIAASAAILAAAVAVVAIRSVPPPKTSLDSTLDSSFRRQIIGDAAIIEKGVRTGWADVFALEGDRFLASFAIPGVSPAVRTTTEAKLKDALNSPIPPPDPDASLEARQIRAIVAGIKAELRDYLAAGGTLAGYGQRLCERQDEEVACYERAKNEIENAKDALSEAELMALWDKRNSELRNLGMRFISLE